MTWDQFKAKVDEYLASKKRDGSIALDYIHTARDEHLNFYIEEYDGGLAVWADPI